MPQPRPRRTHSIWGVQYVFLSNWAEVQFWNWQREAFPRHDRTFFKQDDLERRAASYALTHELGQVLVVRVAVQLVIELHGVTTDNEGAMLLFGIASLD